MLWPLGSKEFRLIEPNKMTVLYDCAKRRIPAPSYPQVGQRVWLSTKDIPIRGGTRKSPSWRWSALRQFGSDFLLPWGYLPRVQTKTCCHPCLVSNPDPPPFPPNHRRRGKPSQSTNYWTAGAKVGASSTLSTGRAMALRRSPGLLPGLSWIRH